MEFNCTAELLIYSQSLTSQTVKQLELSKKVVLPKEILEETFKIENVKETKYYILTNITEFGVFTKIVAVHDFTAPNNTIYLPTKLAEDLYINRGDNLIINEYSLIKGEYIKVKPLCKEFFNKINIKELFEETINKKYPMLSVGEILTLINSDIQIKVVECLPENTISTVDTNINVDFEKPDFEIPGSETNNTPDVINNINRHCSNIINDCDDNTEEYVYIEPDSDKFIPFSGKGYKLGFK